jgi:hypothetical protein
MSTVCKRTADDIISGMYADDDATRIVKYQNAFNGEDAYGVTFGRQDKDKYLIPSEFIINPVIYWEAS